MRGRHLRVPFTTSGGLEDDAGRTHGAGLLHERTRRELRRGLTRDRLTQRAGRETHGGTRRHRASSLLVEARRNALAYHITTREISQRSTAKTEMCDFNSANTPKTSPTPALNTTFQMGAAGPTSRGAAEACIESLRASIPAASIIHPTIVIGAECARPKARPWDSNPHPSRPHAL